MSKKELSRLELAQAMAGSRLTQMEAAGRLKLSVLQAFGHAVHI